MLRLAIVLVMAAGFGCEQQSCGAGRLESVVSDLAGSDAVNCGFARRGADSSAINDCVAQALAKSAAFYVRYEWGDPPRAENSNTFTVEGIARAADGRVWSVDLLAGRCENDACDGVILSAECRNEFTFRPVNCSGFCSSSISCASEPNDTLVCSAKK